MPKPTRKSQDFKIKQTLFLIFNCAIGLLLLSCATPSSTGPTYAAHTARIDQAAKSTLHKIKRADGYAVSAREFGEAPRKGRPTIIVMHGFPDNQHLYDEVIPLLAKEHHVVSFDFLGWGASDKPMGHVYNVASQRADLQAVINHFDLINVVLVVHDLSGHVGIDWALDNEQATSALVLLNTYYQAMPTLKAPPAIQTFATPGIVRDVSVWAAGQSTLRFRSGVGSQLKAFFSNSIMRDAYIPILTYNADLIYPAFVSSTFVLWQEIALRRGQLPRMRAFNKPVWIIFGVDDPYLNIGVANEFHRSFPRSQLHLIPRAGHYVQLDAALIVAGILETNLASLSQE